LVFCSTIGTLLDQTEVLKLFRALLTKAKLGERRFHDLRHSCGMFLAINKVPVAVAQQILGHARPALR
jgi:integrase